MDFKNANTFPISKAIFLEMSSKRNTYSHCVWHKLHLWKEAELFQMSR